MSHGLQRYLAYNRLQFGAVSSRYATANSAQPSRCVEASIDASNLDDMRTACFLTDPARIAKLSTCASCAYFTVMCYRTRPARIVSTVPMSFQLSACSASTRTCPDCVLLITSWPNSLAGSVLPSSRVSGIQLRCFLEADEASSVQTFRVRMDTAALHRTSGPDVKLLKLVSLYYRYGTDEPLFW